MELPALRRVLVALAGGTSTLDLTALTPADWQELDRMAGEHRLMPLLHHRLGEDPRVPAEHRQLWHEAYRLTAMTALIQQADLFACTRLLDARGFAPVALKGAWLARHAYPHPALRPMRDIDLLVRRDWVIPAFAALQEAGYNQPKAGEVTLEESLRLDKHLPPLISPRGTVIELHHRLWEPDGRLDHASPRIDEMAVLARAVTDKDGVRHPAPADLLIHLIVHAVYSHRLDCGPLVLSDIAYLLQAEPIDWATFWREGHEQGWRGGARLMLELVAANCPGVGIDFSADKGESTPPELLEMAADLLLHRLNSRSSARFAASTLKDGSARILALIKGERSNSAGDTAVRDTSQESGKLAWALSRTWRTISDLSRGEVRRQSRQLADLSRWLDQ